MSSREPMWYCHECHAEMRPLMVPDPHCASCQGTFVEKIENPSDDPREFAHAQEDDDLDNVPPGMDLFMRALSSIVQPRATRSPSNPPDSPGITFSFSSSGAGSGARTIRLGGGRTLGGDPSDGPPTMSEFNRRGPDADGIAGPLMMQYLMAMLAGGAGRHGDEFLSHLGDPAQHGRMGDYVFNQEALDQIISQLMENSNSHRPVPAPDDVIQKLPRELLEEGSPMLEKDCAVCKEQFQLGTEDPNEQIVVTLPCQHPFHEPCITPWLKSSGTCPVCRYALVPQPTTSGPHPESEGGPSDRASNSPPTSRGGGLLSSIFGSGGSSSGNAPPSQNSSRDGSGHPSDNDSPHMPGNWN